MNKKFVISTLSIALSPFLTIQCCYALTDMSGEWKAELKLIESDCKISEGTFIENRHTISHLCEEEAKVELIEDGSRTYHQMSHPKAGKTSFHVQFTTLEQKRDMSYSGFDGTQVDVELKVRNYKNGLIVCTELYRGKSKFQDK